MLDNDGNIRLGLQQFGDAIFIDGVKNRIYLNANRISLITDELEWNELTFNKASVNPSQPALQPKKESVINKELAQYDK